MIQKPGASYIRKQGNRDFRHSNARFFCHYPVRTSRHHTQTATHHNTVAPANDWLTVSIKRVIQAVFAREKIFSVVTGTAGRGYRGLVQRLNIASGAKGFLSSTLNKNSGDSIIVQPSIQLFLQQVDHFQCERIQRSRNIQRYPTHFSGSRRQLLEHYRWFRHRGVP